MQLSRRLAGVIGQPIAHSLSPALHRAAYARLGADVDYVAHDVAPAELDTFIAALRREPWIGLSVTMPHKAAVAELVDHLNGDAVALGVVNTVLVEEGLLTGTNTDVQGIVASLRHAGLERVQGRVKILGAGGTALAAMLAAHRLGAQDFELLVRDPSRDGSLAALATSLGAQLTTRVLEPGTLRDVSGGEATPLVMSTLPPHAADWLVAGADPLPTQETQEGIGGSGQVLLDVAYSPWPSALATAWTASGGQVVSGLEMLLYQAVEQVALFTGIDLGGRDDVINVMCDSVGLPRR
ncbi:shikimate dehydrogenase [Psychromicrobium xiongbiense]|uniref:shikimate dehydrogenase family protein n=1 Tax=Psychromicrobium xiongbiense TaxID=3051184 RepID=UPI003075D97A